MDFNENKCIKKKGGVNCVYCIHITSYLSLYLFLARSFSICIV